MYFIASKILWLIFSPSNFLLLSAAVGTLLIALRRRMAGLVLIIPSLALLLIIGFWHADEGIARSLESRFPPWHDDGRPVDGVIVLGGSIRIGPSAAWETLSLNGSADRLIAMADLARRYPSAKIVFTGGYGALYGRAVSEADLLERHAAEFGLASGRILYERQSRNTRENAVFTHEMLHPAPNERWLLVTSAWHMPRSIGLFRKAGWTVEAYPVGWTTAPGFEDSGTAPELSEHLARFDTMVREWMGLIAARVAGYSDDVLPSP